MGPRPLRIQVVTSYRLPIVTIGLHVSHRFRSSFNFIFLTTLLGRGALMGSTIVL